MYSNPLNTFFLSGLCNNILPREAVVEPTWPNRLQLGSQNTRSKQSTTLFKFPKPSRIIASFCFKWREKKERIPIYNKTLPNTKKNYFLYNLILWLGLSSFLWNIQQINTNRIKSGPNLTFQAGSGGTNWTTFWVQIDLNDCSVSRVV